MQVIVSVQFSSREQHIAVEDALSERDRQDKMFGQQDHHPAYWLAILGKQVGQLGEAVVNREWAADPKRARDEMRAEAVQVVAVGLALIEAINRGELPETLVTAKPKDPRTLARALGRDDETLPYDKDGE